MRNFLLLIILGCFLLNGCHKSNPSTPHVIPGVEGTVNALTVFNGNLIVGGGFDSAGGIKAQNIAQWNGQTWSSIGSIGGDYYITQLVVCNGSLIAALSNGNIVQWNGSSWLSIENKSNKNYRIGPLVAYNGSLIVGGLFDSISGIKANNIASWNGTNWAPIGSGIILNSIKEYGIWSMYVYNNNLLVSGSFDSAGGVSAKDLAQWNGTTWSAFGSYSYSGIGAFCQYNGNLTVAGYFDSIGGVPANSVAEWDGSNWTSLSSDENYFSNETGVVSICNYNGNLIATLEEVHVIILNGTTWSAIGTAYSNNHYSPYAACYTSAVYNGNLYVGGGFVAFTNATAIGIVKWNGSTWSALQ